MTELRELREENEQLRHEKSVLLKDVKDDSSHDGRPFSLIWTSQLYGDFFLFLVLQLPIEVYQTFLSFNGFAHDSLPSFFSDMRHYVTEDFLEEVDSILASFSSIYDYEEHDRVVDILQLHRHEVMSIVHEKISRQEMFSYFNQYYEDLSGQSLPDII